MKPHLPTAAPFAHAGCYCCLARFRAEQVIVWADAGATALCPCCGADSVLPGVSDLGLLRAMHERHYAHAETVPAYLALSSETLL